MRPGVVYAPVVRRHLAAMLTPTTPDGAPNLAASNNSSISSPPEPRRHLPRRLDRRLPLFTVAERKTSRRSW